MIAIVKVESVRVPGGNNSPHMVLIKRLKWRLCLQRCEQRLGQTRTEKYAAGTFVKPLVVLGLKGPGEKRALGMEAHNMPGQGIEANRSREKK